MAFDKKYGWLELNGIEFECILGVYPAERQAPRPVRIDAAVLVDTATPAARDDFVVALNYERIESEIVALAQRGQFALVETLAERIVAMLLKMRGVQAARLRVEKPAALPQTRSVAVTLERRRGE